MTPEQAAVLPIPIVVVGANHGLRPDVERILAEARAERPGWMVFDEQRILKEMPTFFFRLETSGRPGETIQEARRFRQSNRDRLDTARVYRYQAAGR